MTLSVVSGCVILCGSAKRARAGHLVIGTSCACPPDSYLGPFTVEAVHPNGTLLDDVLSRMDTNSTPGRIQKVVNDMLSSKHPGTDLTNVP